MATRRQYGTTWWGAAWLAALEKVDDANRLPRGKSYANTGRVEQLSLAADRPGCVEAFVSGSVYYPYEVTVGMKPISARDAKRLTAAIAADPDWLPHSWTANSRTASPISAESSTLSFFREAGVPCSFPALARTLHACASISPPCFT